MSEPQGDVVDEIASDSPLPNTGGVSLVGGMVLTLGLFSAALLVVQLAGLWRARRA